MAPSRSPRRFALFGVIALAVALGAACLAPTLPIPPPTSPEISVPDANGLVTVKGSAGSAESGSVVYGCNEAHCEQDIHGSAAATDGSWEIAPLAAKSGDHILVWQVIGQDTSGTTRSAVP